MGAAGLLGAPEVAVTGDVAGVELLLTVAIFSGDCVVLRKNTEARAAAKTRVAPINPMRIGVQIFLGREVCARDFLLTILLPSRFSARRVILKKGAAFLQPLIIRRRR